MAKRKMLVLLAAVLCTLWVGLRWAISFAQPLHTLGISNGRLADCPKYANCVSSQATNSDHRMDPVPYTHSAKEAQRRLESIIRVKPRSRIVTSQPGYVHAEFSSLLFGFVDDLELAIDSTGKLIHFRSASRMGRSDFGVNRRRMDQIQMQFQER